MRPKQWLFLSGLQAAEDLPMLHADRQVEAKMYHQKGERR
jgi:hypothetical protein